MQHKVQLLLGLLKQAALPVATARRISALPTLIALFMGEALLFATDDFCHGFKLVEMRFHEGFPQAQSTAFVM
jgi:hypothetical protein